MLFTKVTIEGEVFYREEDTYHLGDGDLLTPEEFLERVEDDYVEDEVIITQEAVEKALWNVDSSTRILLKEYIAYLKDEAGLS